MGSIITTRSMAVSAETLWSTLSDLKQMPEWHRSVSSATLEGEGLGARRHIKTYDDHVMIEQITNFDSARRALGFDVFDLPSPLSTLQGEFRVVSTGADTCELSFEVDYTLVLGILGAALDALVVRSAIRAQHADILADLEQYLLTGVHIGENGPIDAAAAAK